MSQAGSRAGSARSGMSEARRERLMDIQKREQLKGMLVSKFKLKYGDKPQLTKYIDNEVARFLKNGRLTEDHLRTLDTKISKEADLRDKREAILEDRKSNAGSVRSGRPMSHASQASRRSANANNQDARSVHSVKSSRRSSQPMSVRSSRRGADQMSVTSSQADRRTEVYSELAEEDEWTAIQKFNTLLHYEEQKQAMLREQERRRLVRDELDKQMLEKKSREDYEKVERRQYEALQDEHVKLLGMRESEKMTAQREKIMQEKESRDRQLREEKTRKRHEEKDAFRAEVDLVTRLKEEMEMERSLQQEKRRQEKQYLQKMLRENEANKLSANEQRNNEVMADVKAQMEYGQMLDKQENDRLREFKAREARAQNFMNVLAGDVISKQQGRIRAEQEGLQRYEHEKEMRARLEDERRAERIRQEKEEMRKLLARQMQEKQRREHFEKSLNDEQAVIWKTDKDNYELEEQRLANKIAGINRDNQDFLRRQMDEKANKGKMRRMNKEEFAYNKHLLREINDKRKASNYDGESRGEEMGQME